MQDCDEANKAQAHDQNHNLQVALQMISGEVQHLKYFVFLVLGFQQAQYMLHTRFAGAIQIEVTREVHSTQRKLSLRQVYRSEQQYYQTSP